MSDNPYETSGIPRGASDPPPADVLGKVTPPAIALMVVGGLNILLSLWGLAQSVMNMMGGADAQKDQLIQQWRQSGMSEEQIEQLGPMIDILTGPAGLVVNGIALAVSIVILVGAMRMKNASSWGFAMTASILAMIPCLSQCCLLGLPFGIWAIVVLNNPDVKRSFR